MSQPVTQRMVYDCVLYNGETEVLEIRLHELADVVHRFVVVESDTTHSELPKIPSFDPSDPRLAPFSDRIRYVVVKDMPPTDPLQREAWQRNAVLRGVPDAAGDDLVIISHVDEIPRGTVVKDMAADTANSIFGLQLALYYFFVNYRNVEGPEAKTISMVAGTRDALEKAAQTDLLLAVRRGDVSARIVSDAGWHFSYLMNEEGAWRKIRVFADQRDKNDSFLSSINIPNTVRYRRDVFNRPGFRWDLIDRRELPAWLQANQRVLSPMFFPCSMGERLLRWIAPDRRAAVRRRSAAAPPVIICPYIHAHEEAEIRATFGLDEPHGSRLEFFLWHDTDRIGPERAFEYCWNRFPDRDIIILHSDMAPMPGDDSNRWYDSLIDHRDALPQAGIVACNLFYPRSRLDEPWRVQCAGGTFREGRIAHIHGTVLEYPHSTEAGVPDVTLRELRPVDWVTFGGVLIRRDVIRACGPFDRRYRWAYVMDVDYSFEARLRGFRLYQVPVSLQHEENRTTRPFWEADPKFLEYMARNFDLFYEKWRPFSAALPSIG